MTKFTILFIVVIKKQQTTLPRFLTILLVFACVHSSSPVPCSRGAAHASWCSPSRPASRRMTSSASAAPTSITPWNGNYIYIQGPILNSGMCSEVFQFDISTATNSGGMIPASPIVNSSSVNGTQQIPTPTPAYHGKLKNRRIMYNEAIPLTGKTVNNTEPFNRTSESSKLPDSKPASSVVVSVLADPREAGDGDSDPRISPKPLSRIFVVVLIDGVRYVTYSCTLPFKSASSHLVN